MIAYILILYMSGYNGGGPAMVRFDDKDACEAAKRLIEKQLDNRVGAAICVPAATAR